VRRLTPLLVLIPALAACTSPAGSVSPAPSTHDPSTRSVTTPTAKPAPNALTLRDFRIRDLSFVGPDHGWAFGKRACGPKRCFTLARTRDGGRSWQAVPAPPARVAHIRFATGKIGYAYASEVLFMTTDGGQHWIREPGLGADELEVADGNAILVGAVNAPSVLFERAPIGSSHWTPFEIGSFYTDAGVGLARVAHDAVLAAIPYNSAQEYAQAATLYRSSNDGATWTKIGEPCPPVRVDHSDNTMAVTFAPDGTIVVACSVRSRTRSATADGTITSRDDGRTFTARVPRGKTPLVWLLAAASHDDQFLEGIGGLYRSTNAGDSWARVSAVTGRVSYIAFQTTTVGRAVTDGGRKIWTTLDAGRTWHAFDFS
jgi:photosystem II stability/assembly factor-like uncharacterized protein